MLKIGQRWWWTDRPGMIWWWSKKSIECCSTNNNNNNLFNTNYSLLVSCCVLKYTGFSFSIECPTLFFELHIATINNTTGLCNFIHILMCGLNTAQEPTFCNLFLECDQRDSELGVMWLNTTIQLLNCFS